jgi:hypothetical protein
MERFQGKHIEIRSDRVQLRELDGDLIESSDTLVARIRPAALWICVPRSRHHRERKPDRDRLPAGQVLVNALHGDGTRPDGRGDPLDRSEPHVADGEHPGDAGLHR